MSQGQDPNNTAQHLDNPYTLYYHPPFKRQPQQWPGLVSQMEPRPDHGEQSYVGSNKMQGRKVLITGGDSGIGRAAAIALAREGADIAINYLPQEESDATEVAELLQQEGRKVIKLPGDLSQREFCKQLVTDAREQLGGLDGLVLCAALQQQHADFLDISDEEFDKTLKTNAYALFWLVKEAVPHLPAGSSIVTTTSVNAYTPAPFLVDYSMTKAAIANFTKSTAQQLIAKGIRINCVSPGPFWTPIQVSGGLPLDDQEIVGEDVPFNRPGQPAEIAPLYVLLASTESSFITGQVYGITGGTGMPG